MSCYLRAAAIGAATGGRTFTGVVTLTLTSASGVTRQPEAFLADRRVKALVTVAAAQEYVIDKLPRTPSRLQPVALVARVIAAAGAGAMVARRPTLSNTAAGDRDATRPADVTSALSAAAGRDAEVPPASSAKALACAVAAGTAAIAGASVGTWWRAWAAPRLGRDLPAALVEDAVVLTLAIVASR